MNIKLFVCCHQPVEVPKHPLLVPLQVGAALAGEHFPGFLYDDMGTHISGKNRSYCELTGQYWAWKNIAADYYGFFHYRRYLYPDIQAKHPYRIEKKVTGPLLQKLGYEQFLELIQRWDLILPMGENLYLPVRKHYCDADFHHHKDLELIESIIRERFPAYRSAMEQYLSGTICYFGNLFIMKRDVFYHYCDWLFSILEEFDRRADIVGYNRQEMRVDGYLAERLLGVYRTYRQEELRILEIPGVHFLAGQTYIKRRVLNALLPPGSKRRAQAKKLVDRGSGEGR